VAVVVAESLQAAGDALVDVLVDCEDLEELLDIESALRDDAPTIHPDRLDAGAPFGALCDSGAAGTNEGFTTAMEWGDVDAVLAGRPGRRAQ